MITLTVDDRRLVVTMLQNTLSRIAPKGKHYGFSNIQEALDCADKNTIDIAFLDVEMPEMTGIELAKELQKRNPTINIIFITGYKEYMGDAFGLYASGYLLKPVKEAAIREALNHLRYPIGAHHEQLLKVTCFGNFEIYKDDEAIEFPRSKCKELIAYLIDRKGAICTNDMIMGTLWPDKKPNDSLKSMLRTLISDTRKTLENLGFHDAVEKEHRGVRINPSCVDCDYYKYLDGDKKAMRKYIGEYMTQYEFAEETRLYLQEHFNGDEK